MTVVLVRKKEYMSPLQSLLGRAVETLGHLVEGGKGLGGRLDAVVQEGYRMRISGMHSVRWRRWKYQDVPPGMTIQMKFMKKK